MEWVLGLVPLVLLILGFPLFIVLLATTAVALLGFMQVPGEMVPQLMFGAIDKFSLLAVPFFLFVAFRQALQAMGTVRPVVIAIVAGNVLNVLLNWVLIYGNLGAPAMGAVGSSVSTVIGRWAMLLILVWTGRRHLLPALRPWHAES